MLVCIRTHSYLHPTHTRQTPLSPPNWPGGPNGGFGSDLGLPVLDFPGSGLGGSFDAGDLMLDVPSVNSTMHQ